MKRLLFLLLLLISFPLSSQDIKKVDGVTDTDIKKVSTVSDSNIKKVNGVTLATFTGILDDYPGAGLALSVRKLSTSYMGNCLRVQRSSDNTTQDIGFEADGDLDESALTTFCSGTDGYVIKWYDQSGNGYEFDVAMSKWQIVDNGSVLEKNSRPALFSLDDTPLSETVDFADVSGSSQLYGISVVSASTFINTLCDNTALDFLLFGSDFSNSYALFEGFSSYMYKNTTVSDNSQHICETFVQNASTAEIRIDGSVQSESASGLASFSRSGTFTAWVGSDSADSSESIQELIVYPTNQSSNRSSIYTNVSSYY